MDSANLVLVVGSYAEATAANDDFKALKAGQDDGEYKVVGAVVMTRDASGEVEVKEHGDERTAGGAVLGGTAGLVVGLFAPPLLAATAVGAGIGALWGYLSKRHAEKKLGVDVEEYLPPGILSDRGGRRRHLCRQGRERARQVRQEDQQGDRLGRLRATPEGDLQVVGRGLGRDQDVGRRR